jgi:hypothetical protein
VLKSRGSNHDKQLRELIIDDGRVAVGDRFRNLSGLMTGMPQVVVKLPDGDHRFHKEQ